MNEWNENSLTRKTTSALSISLLPTGVELLLPLSWKSLTDGDFLANSTNSSLLIKPALSTIFSSFNCSLGSSCTWDLLKKLNSFWLVFQDLWLYSNLKSPINVVLHTSPLGFAHFWIICSIFSLDLASFLFLIWDNAAIMRSIRTHFSVGCRWEINTFDYL